MRILVTPWNSNNEIAVEMALMKGVHKLFVCVTKLCERVCVCDKVVCERFMGDKIVCDKIVCVKKWCVCVCVTKLCVKKCVCV